jgi:hypothetical protein
MSVQDDCAVPACLNTRHQLTLMANFDIRASANMLGTLGLAAVKRVLVEGMTHPELGSPLASNPAHRAQVCRQHKLRSRVADVTCHLGLVPCRPGSLLDLQ